MENKQRQIWLSPLLGSNRSRLIERCSDLVSCGRAQSFLYLAASHPLLELVTEGILDGSRNPGLWGDLPVYLFRGFVRKILSSAIDTETNRPLLPRIPIDREELPLKRSLVSQILARLHAANKLTAIGPLAAREGCVNTITSLIGEIQRAARSPAELREIVAARAQDLPPRGAVSAIPSQIDFDKDVALIYSTYCDLLDRQLLTEDDADQLRALQLLRGELEQGSIAAPWLAQVELLVLDGFFDFTPVQGEILRHLIPGVPEVIVNLNYDERNREIFLPLQETVAHLDGIATFRTVLESEQLPALGVLSVLRERLFNPNLTPASPSEATSEDESELRQSEIRFLECGDRDTEIRTIAREIKSLVLTHEHSFDQIALIVRQRAAYADTIVRVMREESLPCNLESRVEANEVPANRAVLKLFSILERLAKDEISSPRIAELADLVKSEYFRLNKEALNSLTQRFDTEYAALLGDDPSTLSPIKLDQLKKRYRIGTWDADVLENVFAYVGSELRVSNWLERAAKLIKELPSATATKELLNIGSGEQERDTDIADQIENAETAKIETQDAEKKRRPSRDVHPATIAWTALVVQSLAERLHAVPREGRATDLRLALLKLLEELNFSKQVSHPIRNSVEEDELPQMMVNFNSLEALRRAFVAAIKSIEITTNIRCDASPATELVNLSSFIEEVRRSLASQSQLTGTPERGGVRVLEATDVRGLRFRAVFIAGLIEGGFPLRAPRDWIYPHEERERLRNYGLTLEDISPATLLKEEHYFYQSACRATQRLYLSRPLMLEDDSETVASYYIDELRRAIAPQQIEAEIIRRDYEGNHLDKISRTPELAIALVRQQERSIYHGTGAGLLPQSTVRRLLTLARNDDFLSGSALRRIEIERQRGGEFFGPYDGEITDPQLLTMLGRRFGADCVHSASSLSVYGNCPYRFFAQRVLRLEPRGEAALDLQAIDAGKLLHDVLRRFFEKHRREQLWQRNLESLRQELADIADRVFDEHERVVPPLNKQIWKIDREIRKILLDQVLIYELEVQEKAAAEGVVPGYFELAFGSTRSPARDPDSKDESLELTRSTFVGQEKIKLSGQIDRVDIARDGTLIAYDYKLSTGSSKEDIKSGRSLQIPIYLEALERLILPGHALAGGGYYVIRGANDRRNKGLHRATALRYSGIGAKAGAVIGDDEWLRIREEVISKIWEFLDRMRAGHFEVNPSQRDETCRFCDFGPVCRYGRYRIERKKRAANNTQS